ncbi:hypothetical protein DFP72DRAFT_154819 [Ephemerocybe angulata]|uniref:Nephrocystin 3-like N-terminal domain-containing protein n=1 Tax=Ephemerocybe angulata TaxID=980116 RepID=A0A8H6LT71_9AGAR|nr:hypothetical protein DFP72DRAFT_154819 [Tulosesus angulatus]
MSPCSRRRPFAHTVAPHSDLRRNIAPGAIHDSNERCDAPKCMKETRVAVQEDIISWIDAEDRYAPSKRIMWVTGPAGTGKTAILGTIADACKERGTLAASFFFSAFSGSESRRTKRYFVPTLAFQLMGHSGLTGTRGHILSSVAQDDGIVFTKNLKEQFNAMVMSPLLSMAQEHDSGAKATPRVIIIDGLDECDFEQAVTAGSPNGMGYISIRRKEDEQTEILFLLLLAVSNPSFPFRILIASRPDMHIRDFFTTEGKLCTRELFLDDKYHPSADIALFYDAKFSTICRRLNINPEEWPGKEVKRLLVRNASGQFIYAATVIRYVEGSPHPPQHQLQGGKPSTAHQRLQHILAQQQVRSSHNPLEALDELYRLVLETCPDPDFSMKWLRASQQTLPDADYFLPVKILRLILEVTPGEEQYTLGPLSSLLPTQISEENLHKPYKFYHKSFLDFIADPARCGQRFLTKEEVLVWASQRLFQGLNRHIACVPVAYYSKAIAIFTNITRASFPVVEPEILASDLKEWTTVLLYARLTIWTDCSAIVQMLRALHRGCSPYCCRRSCRISSRKIVWLLRDLGWQIPYSLQIHRREWKEEYRYLL